MGKSEWRQEGAKTIVGDEGYLEEEGGWEEEWKSGWRKTNLTGVKRISQVRVSESVKSKRL